LPPLRERTGDVPLLVEHILGAGWRIEPDALETLRNHPWPGNVRQLINALERAKIMADGRVIRLQDLPNEIAAARGDACDSHPTGAVTDDLATIQRAHVVDVLRRERGNKARAARALGVNRRSLYRLLDKFDIQMVAEHGSVE